MSMPSSSEAVATIAFNSPVFNRSFGREPHRARHAAVMAGHGVLAQQLAQMVRNSLGHAARVDEDQRAAVRRDQFGQPLVDFGPAFRASKRPPARSAEPRPPDRVRADGRRRQSLHAGLAERSCRVRADQEAGHLFDRPLRGRQADPRRRRRAERASRSSDSARCEPRLSRARA